MSPRGHGAGDKSVERKNATRNHDRATRYYRGLPRPLSLPLLPWKKQLTHHTTTRHQTEVPLSSTESAPRLKRRQGTTSDEEHTREVETPNTPQEATTWRGDISWKTPSRVTSSLTPPRPPFFSLLATRARLAATSPRPSRGQKVSGSVSSHLPSGGLVVEEHVLASAASKLHHILFLLS